MPRIIPVLGLIGGPLLIAAVFAKLLGSAGAPAGGGGLASIPVAAWEFSLGVWLVVKGFRPTPITAAIDAARRRPPSAAPPSSTAREHGPALPVPGRVAAAGRRLAVLIGPAARAGWRRLR